MYAAAERLRPLYPDGQILIELAGLSDTPLSPKEALSVAIRALGAEPAIAENLSRLEAHFRSLLEGKRVFIIADDALDTAQIKPLRPSSGSALVYTSRDRLILPGMTDDSLVDVSPLSLAESTTLLLRICPRFGDRASYVAELCGRLPLALQVSGALLANDPTLSVTEFELNLKNERTRLSALRAFDDPEMDVEAALSLSYVRLPDTAQSVLRKLSVFPSSFWSFAAALIINPEDTELNFTLPELRTLFMRSLIDFDTNSGRYTLHGLVRVFAKMKCTDDELRNSQVQHLRYVTILLAAIDSLYRDGGEAIRRSLHLFDSEQASIKTAWLLAKELFRPPNPTFAREYLDLATASIPIVSIRFHSEDRIQWWKVAAESARILNIPEVEATIHGNLGHALFDCGRSGEALESFERQSTLATSTGSLLLKAQSLISMGRVKVALGFSHEALPLLESALETARELADKRQMEHGFRQLGNAYMHLGEYKLAITNYRSALDTARSLGDLQGEGRAIGSLGLAWAATGEAQRALLFHSQELKIMIELADRRGEGKARGNMGVAYWHLKQYEQAIRWFQACLSIAREVGDRNTEGAALTNIGRVYFEIDDLKQSVSHLTRGTDVFREVQNQGAQAQALVDLSNTYYQLRDFAHALQLLKEALSISQAMKNLTLELGCLRDLTGIANEMGNLEDVLSFAERWAEAARKTGSLGQEGLAKYCLGAAYVQRGFTVPALRHLRSAHELLKERNPSLASYIQEQIGTLTGQ